MTAPLVQGIRWRADRRCTLPCSTPPAARPPSSVPIRVRSPTVVLSRLLRAGEHKTVRRLRAIADHINGLEDDVAGLSDDLLRAHTDEFRRRHDQGESLDELLPETFAVAREAAKRTLGQRHFDAELMGRVHRFLGLEVGVILSQMSPDERRAAYQADITYGTNNEFGFDYLRDNMKFDLNDYVQREHHFCIVDEVDSIL